MKTQIINPSILLRIGLAFVASYYIQFHGRSFDDNMYKNPIFYIAFMVIFVIAMIMITVMHFVSIELDKFWSWHTKTMNRLLNQLLCCFILPLLIDFVLIGIYFYNKGTNIFENGFLRHDYPVIVCFVLLLNSYYIISYLFEVDKKLNTVSFETEKSDKGHTTTKTAPSITHKIKMGKQSDAYDLLHVLCPHITTDLTVKDFVLFFYAYDRDVYIVNHKGNEILVNSSLNRLEDLLSEESFFRINRSFILNSKLFFDYSDGEKRDTLFLFFWSKYDPMVQKYGEDRFTVTKNYISRIMKYMNGF